MEWLLRLVLQLEADPEVRRHLGLFANTAAFERGGRIHLSERAPAGPPAPGDSASVRATGAVREALAAARRPIPHADLAARLLAAIPNATRERVDQLIAQLCQATLLLTDLRPPLTSPDPAGWVADRLAAASRAEDRGPQPTRPLDGGTADGGAVRARDQGARLAALAAEAAALDRLGPAEAEAGHARLAEQLGAGGARSPLQVDARLDLRGAGLHPAVGEAAAGAAELLLRLTPLPDGPPHLAAYRRAFLRRYGPDRMVPLLELLDQRFGLGPLGAATGWRGRPGRPGGTSSCWTSPAGRCGTGSPSWSSTRSWSGGWPPGTRARRRRRGRWSCTSGSRPRRRRRLTRARSRSSSGTAPGCRRPVATWAGSPTC
jgi:hypothetical protein